MTNWELESGSEVIVCDRGRKMIRKFVRSERSESGEGKCRSEARIDKHRDNTDSGLIQVPAAVRATMPCACEK